MRLGIFKPRHFRCDDCQAEEAQQLIQADEASQDGAERDPNGGFQK